MITTIAIIPHGVRIIGVSRVSLAIPSGDHSHVWMLEQRAHASGLSIPQQPHPIQWPEIPPGELESNSSPVFNALDVLETVKHHSIILLLKGH